MLQFFMLVLPFNQVRLATGKRVKKFQLEKITTTISELKTDRPKELYFFILAKNVIPNLPYLTFNDQKSIKKIYKSGKNVSKTTPTVSIITSIKKE